MTNYSQETEELLRGLNENKCDTFVSNIINADYKMLVDKTCQTDELLDDLRWVFSKHGIIAIEGGILAFSRNADKLGITNAKIISERKDWYLGTPVIEVSVRDDKE